MIPLRIALGFVALLALCAALLGACMSIKINWEFATTLGRNSEWAFWIALTFASVEGARLLMPFLRKGLLLSGMNGMAKKVTFAFWTFTCISALSAAGFFSMNRSDSTAQRSAQISQTRSYKAEVDALVSRVEKNGAMRSTGEIQADIKAHPRGDPARLKLDIELATSIQRDKDVTRLAELRGSAEWKTAIKMAITNPDAQLGLFTGASPFDKDTTEKWATIFMIVITITALELLVGFTPFWAGMVLVWACKPQATPSSTSGAGYRATDRPPDNGSGLSNKDGGLPGKSAIPAGLDNPKTDEYSMHEAREDIRRWLSTGAEVPSATVLQIRWRWSNQTTLRKLRAWRDEGILRLEKRGNKVAVLPPKSMDRPKPTLVSASA